MRLTNNEFILLRSLVRFGDWSYPLHTVMWKGCRGVWQSCPYIVVRDRIQPALERLEYTHQLVETHEYQLCGGTCGSNCQIYSKIRLTKKGEEFVNKVFSENEKQYLTPRLENWNGHGFPAHSDSTFNRIGKPLLYEKWLKEKHSEPVSKGDYAKIYFASFMQPLIRFKNMLIR